MKIKILDKAEQDLVDGFRFYERQFLGLGDYFLDSIFSDIESLHLYAGIHAQHFGYYRFSPNGFRLPFIIVSRSKPSACMPFWIVGVIRSRHVVG